MVLTARRVQHREARRLAQGEALVYRHGGLLLVATLSLYVGVWLDDVNM
jgi:hypothetical protein